MLPEYGPYEINFRNILRIIFKKQCVIATVFIVSLSAAFFYINMTVPVYKTSTKILVSTARKTVAPFYTELDAIRRAQPNVTQGEIVKGEVVLEEVVKALHLDQRDDQVRFYPRLKKIVQPKIDKVVDFGIKFYEFIKTKIWGGEIFKARVSKQDQAVENLRLNMEVDQVESSDVFYLTVYDYNPKMASRIANAIARQYIIFDIQQQVLNLNTRYGNMHPKIIQLEEAIQIIRDRGEEMNLEDLNSIGLATVKIVESAKEPYKPSRPRQRIIYILTAIFGFIGGISLAFTTTVIDNTFKNPWELEEQAGIPVLCSVSSKMSGRLISKEIKKKAHETAYSCVTDYLFRLIKEKDIKVITLSDMGDSRNSGINAFNIAYLMANSYSLKVLLLDANFRDSVLFMEVRLPESSALSDVLVGDVPLKKIEMSRCEKLDILAQRNINENPLSILAGESMSRLLSQLKEEYDVIIINTPSLMYYHDPVIMGRQSQGMIVSLREGMIKKEIASNIFASLKKDGILVLGAIFSDRSHPIPGPIYRNV